ncbi:MAG TPA: hypothetical protein VFF14_12395 [Candidatus Deferrimicrobium sp.]|nr:hypothetical protein [Candidatus Deferrimicrobium sp.]
MTLLHCTAKLLKELGNPHLQNPDTPNPEGLGNWYANLLRIDRRKCILFTNEKTLYSFLIAGVKKENLTNIFDEFLMNLNFNLQAEGFSLAVINRVMTEYTEMGFAKTSSKTVLGAMTQITFEAEYLIYHRYEGMDGGKILKVNKDINRSLMRGDRHLHPIEMLQELLTGVKVPRPSPMNL